MGASLDYRVYKGGDRQTIARDFASAVSESRAQDGTSYSGQLGMLSTNIAWHDLKLADQNAAETWLAEHHQKYDAPKAVSFAGGTPNPAKQAKAQALANEASQRAAGRAQFVANLLKAKTFVKCGACESRLKATYVKGTRCPVCNAVAGLALGTRAEKALAKYDAKTTKLQADARELAKPEPNGQTWWIVGGWCGS